jgi:hypothetical protein
MYVPGAGDDDPELSAAAPANLLPLLEPLVLLGLFLLFRVPLSPYIDGCGVRGEGEGGSEGV